MMSRRNYVVVAIVAIAAIATLPLASGLEWMWVQMSLDDAPILGRELTVTSLIAYSIAVAGVVFALAHQRTSQLSLEVVDELSKVTWPSKESTGNATVVVIVTVVISAAYLGLADALWLWVTDFMVDAG